MHRSGNVQPCTMQQTLTEYKTERGRRKRIQLTIVVHLPSINITRARTLCEITYTAAAHTQLE